MKIGTLDIQKVYLGTQEISKIYLGSNTVYDTSTPTPPGQEDIYMSGNSMVVRAGTQMELFTQSSSEIYTLSEDIVISDLLSMDSGTLTNLDTYSYHPSFEEYDYNTVLTTTKVSSGSITIDGVTYNDTPESTEMKTFWEDVAIPNLYKRTSVTTETLIYSVMTPYYYTIKCSGLTPNQKVNISSDHMFNFGSNLQSSTLRFNARIIFHSDADVTNTSAWLKDSGDITITRVLSPWSNMGEITSDSNGEFYITFLIPTYFASGYRMRSFYGSVQGVLDLFNTPLGIYLDASNWQGEGYPNEISIGFQSLNYGSERFKYLITVQTDGSAVITNNPNYQPT